MAKVVDLRINFALGGQPPTSFIIRRIIDKEIKTMIDEYWTWIFYGYHSDDLKQRSHKPMVVKCDMCCKYRISSMDGYRDLCNACSNIGITLSKEARLNISKSKIGVPLSEDHKVALSVGKQREKSPLPTGSSIDHNSKTAKNKKSTQYLGCFIAERLISKMFTDAQVMPQCNPGYDIICNHGKKIDIKSCATGHKGFWAFHTEKNKVADHFLCIAFEDRNTLIPQHVWLIPGQVINHLVGLTIHKSTIDKWIQYEIPVDKAMSCCDDMRNKHKV